MDPLLADGHDYSRSVAFDATKKGDTHVTVGVELTREQEAQLLDICCDEQSDQYRPFATKSRDLELSEVPIETLMTRFSGRVAVGVCSNAPDRHVQAEAAQAAVLYDRLDPSSATVVIADGDERHAELLGQGLKTLRSERVPVVPCQKSEYYYPQSYFADLLAGTLVRGQNVTTSDAREMSSVFTTAESEQSSFWKAYNVIGAGRYDYRVPECEEQRAYTPSTRAKSWFSGAVETGTGDRPMTDSTRRVERWLRECEYTAAAQRIS